LGVIDIQLSLTTLEEVFLTVAESSELAAIQEHLKWDAAEEEHHEDTKDKKKDKKDKQKKISIASESNDTESQMPIDKEHVSF
jgi:hypothetical protein